MILRAAVAAGAVALLALTGCSAAAPELPAGVEVQLLQLRSDVADRTAQVRVVNGSDADLVVTRLQFVDDWFAGTAERDRVSSIAAGRTVDLRIALPASACDGEPAAADRTSRVRLDLEGIGTVTSDVVDTLGFTGRLHERECLEHDAASVAALGIAGFRESPAGSPAVLELGVHPGGGDGVLELVELRTTNLLQFAVDSAEPHPLGVELRGTDPETTIEVPLVPLRCDPHAVMEDKRGTVFGLQVRFEGREGVIDLAAPDDLKGRMLLWVADWCGYGGGEG